MAILFTLALAACADAPRTGDDSAAADSGNGMISPESEAVLSGHVTYRERIALRPDALIHVRLEEVADAEGSTPVLAGDTIAAEGRQVPIPFSLRYDPTVVDSGARYVVRAEILDGDGTVRWRSATPPLVITHDAPSTGVEVMVSSATDTADAETNPDLISARRVWEQARLRGIDFRAVGNEPGWLLEIDDASRLLFAYDYGSERVTAPAPAPVSSGPSGQTVYRVVTDSLEFSFTITRQPCTDTMSGEQFESAVTVEFGGRTYNGCGRYLAANR